MLTADNYHTLAADLDVSVLLPAQQQLHALMLEAGTRYNALAECMAEDADTGRECRVIIDELNLRHFASGRSGGESADADKARKLKIAKAKIQIAKAKLLLEAEAHRA